MNIYKKNFLKSYNLKGNDYFEGKSIEKTLEVAMNNKEPITKGIANMYHTRRQDGVLPETDIRTDRFELGQEAMNEVNQNFRNRIKEKMNQQKNSKDSKDSKAE